MDNSLYWRRSAYNAWLFAHQTPLSLKDKEHYIRAAKRFFVKANILEQIEEHEVDKIWQKKLVAGN